MLDLERIRYVAGHYRSLQGLRMLPLATWFLAVAGLEFYTLMAGRTPLWFVLSVYLGGLVVALGLRAAIGRHYYERRFGDVARYTMEGEEKRSWIEVAAFVGLILLGMAAFDAPSVVGFGIALAAVLLAFWWTQYRFGKHYAVMAILVLIFCLFLPLSGKMDQAYSRSICLVIMGVTLLAGSIFDHLLLIRTMKTAPEEADAGAV